MTKRIVIIVGLFICFPCVLYAQTQQGYVKTKGRMMNGQYYAGKRIGDATVQVKDRSAVRSRTDGTFSFPVSGKSFCLQQVTKQGFVLHDQDVLYRQYSYSSNPLVIVMEDKAQQKADRRALERQVRRITDDVLRRRGEEIETLKEQNKIAEEKYRELLNQLNNDFDKNEQLIKDMVDQYNKIDFDQVDGFNRRVSDCIINGRLDEADSLLRSKGSFAKRETELKLLSDANAADRMFLDQRENIEDNLRSELAQDYYNMYSIFRTKFQFDSASHYLEKRIQLDSTNIDWLLECGYYFESIATYNKALKYYKNALSIQKSTYGEENLMVAFSYNNIGLVYLGQDFYDKALEAFFKTLSIEKKFLQKSATNIATTYNNIGYTYYKKRDYSNALKYLKKAVAQYKKNDKDAPELLVTPYNNIGLVYFELGKYDNAQFYYDKALSIADYTMVEEQPLVAQLYNNIAANSAKLGNYNKALEYFDKSLAIWKRILGENHPDVAIVYINIGSIYETLGDSPRAIEYFNKASLIKKNTANNSKYLK